MPIMGSSTASTPFYGLIDPDFPGPGVNILNPSSNINDVCRQPRQSRFYPVCPPHAPTGHVCSDGLEVQRFTTAP